MESISFIWRKVINLYEPRLSCRSVFVDTITGKIYFIIPIHTRPTTVKLRLTKQAESLRQRSKRWQRLNIFLYIIDDLIAIIKLNGKTEVI